MLAASERGHCGQGCDDRGPSGSGLYGTTKKMHVQYLVFARIIACHIPLRYVCSGSSIVMVETVVSHQNRRGQDR